MFKFLNARYRHITGRHNIPYASLPVTRDLVAVDSIVIPCTGADFVEEALLSDDLCRALRHRRQRDCYRQRSA